MNMMGKIWQNRKNVLRYPIASSKLAASDPSADNDTVGRILRHPESQSTQQLPKNHHLQESDVFAYTHEYLRYGVLRQ